MAGASLSVVMRGESPARVGASLAESFRAFGGPAAGVVFLGGALGERVEEVARVLSGANLGMPLLIAAGAGVLSERGEIEGEPAAAALAFRGGSPQAMATSAGTPDDAAQLLGDRLVEESRGASPTALVCAKADGVGIEVFEPLLRARPANLFGAGTPGGAPIAAIDREGRLELGSIGALLMRGLTPARLRASPACRLLMPLRPVTASRGPLLLEIAGERALDVLTNVAENRGDHPLILTVVAPETTPDGAARSDLLVRGIQGADPTRGAILLAGDLEPGARVAFAVRDAECARSDLELCVRELGRDAGGAAPLFGIYVSCAGRGLALYGSPDVDLRIIRGRFPDVPWVGLHSAFEIAPFQGKANVQFFTGVVGLFTRPS